MTKFLSIMTIAAFLIIGGVSTASAHCGVCEASEKSHKMKVCKKCVQAGKTCNCGKKTKKPCEKKIGSKKPCKEGKKQQKRWEMNKNMQKGEQHLNEKGTYHVQSRGNVNTGYND